jgi:hypothetical protein
MAERSGDKPPHRSNNKKSLAKAHSINKAAPPVNCDKKTLHENPHQGLRALKIDFICRGY